MRHFRNICTKKSFPMKKFERSDDSKLHPCIGSSLLQKIIKQQNLNHSFWPLLEFRHFWKKFYHLFFMENQIFCKFYILGPGFEKGGQGVCCQTVTYNEWNWSKHLILIQKIYVLVNFQDSGSDKTPFPEVTKLRFLFTKCPLLFTRWLS